MLARDLGPLPTDAATPLPVREAIAALAGDVPSGDAAPLPEAV